MAEVAQRLLALEARRAAASPGSRGPPSAQQTVRVFDVLRLSLSRFAGPDGFNALLRRALALARSQLPPGSLAGVKVGADGSLEGWDESANEPPRAAEVVVTEFLELLVTLIGRSLTLRLVGQAWPEMGEKKREDVKT
jgi:hypothetical protein